VSPVNCVIYQKHDITIPLDPSDPNAKAGPLAQRLANDIMAIQYGEQPHAWSVVVE
jgi:branched-chain amino acid aminotransferase